MALFLIKTWKNLFVLAFCLHEKDSKPTHTQSKMKTHIKVDTMRNTLILIMCKVTKTDNNQNTLLLENLLYHCHVNEAYILRSFSLNYLQSQKQATY